MKPGIRWTSDRLVPGDVSTARRRPRLLLLCDYRPYEAATVVDHIEAIRQWSTSDVFVLPMFGDIPEEVDLEAFDGLIIHYNLIMSSGWYLSAIARLRISQYTGVKAAFIQDEYRHVNDTVSVMRTLGINVLFTCVPSDQAELVYPRSLLPQMKRRISILTGYVTDALRSVPVLPWDARPLDVGYRGRRLPAWLGSLAQEKVAIAERFAADAAQHGLTVDISCEEADRLYGTPWVDFIRRSKAMLGVESGASVFDFDGSIERNVRQHLGDHPDTSFAELRRRYFDHAEGQIRLNQISPRCFEAAALGTLMVLYPGDYSGILRPWQHYVPLEKDHSNMDEVVAAIRDRDTWGHITQRARDEVALNPAYSYGAMVDTIDAGLDLRPAAGPPVDKAEFSGVASRSFARMEHTRLRAYGLPATLGRIRVGLGRAIRLLTPSAVAIASSPWHETEKLPGPRNVIRRARALTYWALRPGLVPWSALLRGGRTLLEDLGELRRLQAFGARARTLAPAFPYVVLFDPTAGMARIILRTDLPSSIALVNEIPPGLCATTAVELQFTNRWLVPIEKPDRLSVRLQALSAIMAARPDVARRLLTGPSPWCDVAIVGPDGGAPPEP